MEIPRAAAELFTSEGGRLFQHTPPKPLQPGELSLPVQMADIIKQEKGFGKMEHPIFLHKKTNNVSTPGVGVKKSSLDGKQISNKIEQVAQMGI